MGRRAGRSFLMVARCQGNQGLKRLLFCKTLSLYVQSLITAETTAWVQLFRVQFRQPPARAPLSTFWACCAVWCMLLSWHRDKRTHFHPWVPSTSRYPGLPNRALAACNTAAAVCIPSAGLESREQPGPAARPALPAACHGGELRLRPRRRGKAGAGQSTSARPEGGKGVGPGEGGKWRLCWGTAVEKGVWRRRDGLEGKRAAGRTALGFAWWGWQASHEKEGGRLQGQEAGGEWTGCMDSLTVGSKLFHLARGNVWYCKKNWWAG